MGGKEVAQSIREMSGGHYCSRCKTVVPLKEWLLSSTGESWKHIGRMRDQSGDPDKYATICDEGDDGECGWITPIPSGGAHG